MNRTAHKFIIPAALALLLAGAAASCNSNSEEEQTESISRLPSSTLVKSFSLKPNSKIMANLDSVYFSIDQVNARIFNADSLPWGTDVRKLTVNVIAEATGSIEIIMPSLTSGRDTTINLQQNPTDSINFSRGEVWLRIGSQNSEFERIYSLKVNVHSCNPDSLQWQTETRRLPAASAGATAQRAAELAGTYYSLSLSPSGMQIAFTKDVDSDSWASETLAGISADVNSFTATTDALYLLGSDGTLLSSADGLDWTRADTGWTHVYGAYANQLIGLKDGRWIAFPSGASGPIPDGMPTGGTSQMWTFSNDWDVHPQALLVGAGNAWGFDGSSWMRLSGYSGGRNLPEASRMQVFPYFTFSTDKKTLVTTRQSAWIAMGGLMPDGCVQKEVYVSLDNGVNWRKAPQSLQLPAEVAPAVGGSVLLVSKEFNAGSRAVRPITQWSAPYVYFFGGSTPSGALIDRLLVGVINRLTFKPLQ